MSDPLDGTQIGIDGKRHALADLGGVTAPPPAGYHVFGTPGQGKVPIWNASSGRLEYGFPTASDGTFVAGDQTAITAPDTSAAVALNVTGLAAVASPDGTIAAVPDPANSPVDADALRDDLVTNVLPAIRNAIAEVAAASGGNRTAILSLETAINDTITRLETAGVVAPN